jgi:hypothetical protein
LSLNDGAFEVTLFEGQEKKALGALLNDGEWHHVLAVVPEGATTLKEVLLYVDGRLADAVGVGEETHIQTSQANWIGIGVLLSRSGFNLGERMAMEPFEGWLDDFCLWTRALSAAEVAVIHARGRNGIGARHALAAYAKREG